MKDTIIRPYGDTSNDGKMQFSFTLPVSADEYGLVLRGSCSSRSASKI